MKILFITPRFPFPPNRGDCLRYYNFAKMLSRKHELHLLSFIASEKEKKYLGELSGIFSRMDTVLLRPWKSYLNMALRFFSRIPLQVSYFHSKEMQAKVAGRFSHERYDAVYVFHLRMAPYAREMQNVYKILDLTDSVSLFLKRMVRYRNLLLRPILYKEYLSTRRYESEIVKEFDESWLISDIDKEGIDFSGRDSNMVVVPNGVDSAYFSPDPSLEQKDNNILFVGYMGVESIDAVKYFIKHIFPLVQEKVPSAKFYIVGANPPSEIARLGKEQNIVVTGFVKDLRRYYSNAAVVIAPMRFVAGVQNKILEAMAMGVPVVTSSLGNEGINAMHGEGVFVEDRPDKFALRVIELLNDDRLRRDISRGARNFVKNNFSWHSVVERIEKVEKKLSK